MNVATACNNRVYLPSSEHRRVDISCFVSILVASVLLSAAVRDVRTREVGDIHWWLILAIGIIPALFCGPAETVSSVGAALVCAGFMLDGKFAYLAHLSGATVCVFCAVFSDCGMGALYAPIVILVFYPMYVAGILPGGADVKCLMSLAVAFPQNTYQAGYLALMFPPSVCILVYASVLLLAVGGIWIIMKRGPDCHERFPNYRVSVEEAESSFVFIREDTGGLDERGYLRRLKAEGRRDVTVSPMFPFVPFILAGFVIWHIVGIAI